MNTAPSLQATMPLESATTQPDALQLLLDGHERLRKSLALALHLGHAQAAHPAERARIAAQLVHYFTLVLPLHIDEEDYALTPCLLAAGVPQEAVPHLWEVGRQHEELEEQVEQLIPLWAIVRDTPERYPELAHRLVDEGQQLATLMEAHLALEEQHLFPLVRSRLSPEMLAVLATQILERRGQLT